MLCGKDFFSRCIFHGIASDVTILAVIVENKISSKTMIKRRLKRFGALKVGGQVLFMFVNKILSRLSHARTKQLIKDFQLNDTPIPDNLVIEVDSVNDHKTIELLKSLNPDAIVVNGTRIISTAVLESINRPFINTHAGITPEYRGVHGGYWALVNKSPENCGVTVHLVDQGIDTGGILYQDVIHPNRADRFCTYPIHQIAKAIPLMIKALNDVLNNQLVIQPKVASSNLWYHPTLFEYLKNWLFKGVK